MGEMAGVPWLYMYWSLFKTFLLRCRVYSKINANVLTKSDLNFWYDLSFSN